MSFRRIPFTPDDADALIAFCAAQRDGRDPALARTLLLDLTSDAAGVIVLADEAGVALVATVVDRVRNGADAATLEMLGVRVAPAPQLFVRMVVEPALAFARAGERRALHIALPPSLAAGNGPLDGQANSEPECDVDAIAEALRAAGFAHAYDTFEMRRPASAPPPAPPDPLPPGWSWVTIDDARADAAHAALAEMFRDAPATHLMPVEDFRRAVASGAAVWRALLDGDRIAGLVRAIAHGGDAPGERRGELRVLGRVPAYRGRGLGPRLVAEGLRRLRAGDDLPLPDVDLALEATNDRALDLYRRFGFQIVARTPVFGRPLRASDRD